MSGTKQSSNQVLDLAVNIAAETDGFSLGSGAGRWYATYRYGTEDIFWLLGFLPA